MNPFCILMTLLLFFTSIKSHAQEVYSWEDGICTFTGTIRSSETSTELLNGLYGVLWNTSEMNRPYLLTRPSDSAYIKLNLVEKECANYLNELKTLQVPKDTFWVTLKNKRIQELNEQCDLRKKAIQAIENPAILLLTSSCDSCVQSIQTLIKGGEPMLQAWKKQHEQDVISASHPEYVQAVFDYRWNSKDRLIWAKIELMRYTWWNCAAKNTYSIENYGEINAAFQLFFKGITQVCL